MDQCKKTTPNQDTTYRHRTVDFDNVFKSTIKHSLKITQLWPSPACGLLAESFTCTPLLPDCSSTVCRSERNLIEARLPSCHSEIFPDPLSMFWRHRLFLLRRSSRTNPTMKFTLGTDALYCSYSSPNFSITASSSANVST